MASLASPARPRPRGILLALTLLYAAQGVPYGFASEYLPVVLRQAHYSLGQIAAAGWLQLPWLLKIFWSTAADRRAIRARSRGILLTLQVCLFASLALFALAPLTAAPRMWFGLTFVAALLASTQDIFVDALAVRSLLPSERGFGNTAQVAGYRLGMLAGGAGLLLLVAPVGYRAAVLCCAALVLFASVSAFFLRDEDAAAPSGDGSAGRERLPVLRLLRHMFSPRVWPIAVIALTYKLGLHMAAVLIKPIVVDAHWSDREIGLAVVTLGTTAGLTGAALGGLVHRLVQERRAMILGALVQAVVCLPLLVALHYGLPKAWTTAAIATEHFVSGLGTTILFAALMSATRREDAGLHYTLLTSANALAIGVGGQVGGLLADRLGYTHTLEIAVLVCVAPLALLGRWDEAASASADRPSLSPR